MSSLKRYGIFILIPVVLFLSCKNRQEAPTDRIPVLEVEGKYLYLDQIENIIPPDVNPEDSLNIVKNYIRKWATDVLLYENAKRNVSDVDEIDKLIEDYRKSLTIHQYQQKLLSQKLPQAPSDSSMRNFYAQYKDQFVLTEPILRGLLLVLPQGTSNLANVRKWVQSGNDKSLSEIEKYSVQNALSYDYFLDRWIPLKEILRKLPIQIENPNSFVSAKSFYEIQDSTRHFFLKIREYRRSGDNEPFDQAKERISVLMMNKLRSDFMDNFERGLYDDAVNDGTITFFNEKNK